MTDTSDEKPVTVMVVTTETAVSNLAGKHPVHVALDHARKLVEFGVGAPGLGSARLVRVTVEYLG